MFFHPSKVRYFHIRPIDLTRWDVKRCEYPVSNKGGVTIAYIVEKNTVTFAIAQCSNKDQFSRKVGRELAHSRLTDPFSKKMSVVLPSKELKEIRKFFSNMFYFIKINEGVKF